MSACLYLSYVKYYEAERSTCFTVHRIYGERANNVGLSFYLTRLLVVTPPVRGETALTSSYFFVSMLSLSPPLPPSLPLTLLPFFASSPSSSSWCFLSRCARRGPFCFALFAVHHYSVPCTVASCVCIQYNTACSAECPDRRGGAWQRRGGRAGLQAPLAISGEDGLRRPQAIPRRLPQPLQGEAEGCHGHDMVVSGSVPRGSKLGPF